MHIPGYATTNLKSMSNQHQLQAGGLLSRIAGTRNDPFLGGV